LQQLLRRAACLDFSNNDDPVRQVRCWQRAAVLTDQPTALPHLRDISFGDAESCRQRIGRFAPDAEARRRISASQWANVRDRLTFPAGMSRVVSTIRQRLIERHSAHGVAASRQQPLEVAGGVHA
jgi:hypothetical protein